MGVVSIFFRRCSARSVTGITSRAVNARGGGLLTLTCWNPGRPSPSRRRRRATPAPGPRWPPHGDQTGGVRAGGRSSRTPPGQEERRLIYLSRPARPSATAQAYAIQPKALILIAGRYRQGHVGPPRSHALRAEHVDGSSMLSRRSPSGGELPVTWRSWSMREWSQFAAGALGHARFRRGLLHGWQAADYNHYTDPKVSRTRDDIPEVLLGGNHEHIRR